MLLKLGFPRRLKVRLDAWLSARLANRVAFNAMLLAVGLAMVLAFVSFLFTQHMFRQRTQVELEHAAAMVGNQLEIEINSLVRDVHGLAGNRMISNALLDSGGREIYLTPFMQSYRLHLEAAALCMNDFLGRPLACNRRELINRHEFVAAPWLQAVIGEAKPYVEINKKDGGGGLLLLAIPVLSPATGMSEGMLTVSVDLTSLLRGANDHLPADPVVMLMAKGQMVAVLAQGDVDTDNLLTVSRGLVLNSPADGLMLTLRVAESHSSMILAMVWLVLLYFALITLIVPAVFWFARRMSDRLTAQISALSDAANHVSDGGVLSWQANVGGVDEIGVLERSFIKMLEHLREAQNDLEQRVEDRTFELQGAMEALKEARDVAERANRAKSEFLASMSHELRTPLNAIQGFAQLLETDPDLNAAQKDQMREINKAGAHLLSLINEILDLAKIEAGRINLTLEFVSVGGLLNQCRSLIEPMAVQRGVKLDCSVEACKDIGVQADRLRFKQVLLNLLSNAVKYNRPEGRVTVDCVQDEGMLRIEVRDTGIGIDQQHIEGLFDMFNRLGMEGSNIQGAGIGLVITKKLVEMMGGQVGVISVPGQGSTFWFTLPVADEKVEEAKIVEASGTTMAAFEPESEQAHHRLLYVEDDEVNRNLLAAIIARRKDCVLDLAAHPLEGIEKALSQKPDVILLDINLPEMSGIEVLARLREDDETRAIPVIAVSANAMPNQIQEAMDVGFDGYVTKPIMIKDFFAVLDEVLEKNGH